MHCAALLDSTQIAGLNCLKLVNEITATAIAYGIYKTDLPESDPMHVMFVDIGDSHMSVGVVAFQKGKLRVRPRPRPRPVVTLTWRPPFTPPTKGVEHGLR